MAPAISSEAVEISVVAKATLAFLSANCGEYKMEDACLQEGELEFILSVLFSSCISQPDLAMKNLKATRLLQLLKDLCLCPMNQKAVLEKGILTNLSSLVDPQGGSDDPVLIAEIASFQALLQSPNPFSISDLIPPSAEEKKYLEASENADCPVSDSTGTGLLELVDVLVLQMERCVKSAKEKESPDGRCYECLLTISQLFLNGVVLLYLSDGQLVADHLASNTAQVETLIEALILCYSPPRGKSKE